MMNQDRSREAWILGLSLAAGFAVAGGLLGRALETMRTSDRHVTVRGFSEREVPADMALWPIVFNATGNDLTAVHGELEHDEAAVRTYLEAQGFPSADISVSIPRLTDHQAFARQEGMERYMAEVTVTLRSADVERVRAAMQGSGILVREGVALIRSYEYNPQFLFTELEAIKPAMIAEATRDARRAAEQFAEDSGSRVGAIRSAQQGYFSVEDRDAFSPEYKKVRVVTTVQYLLEGGR